MKSNIVLLILVAIIIVLGYMLYQRIDSNQNLTNVIATNDRTITNYVDENNKLNSRVGVLTLTNSEVLKDLNTKDSMLKRMQETAKSLEHRNKQLLAIVNTTNNILIQYEDSIVNLVTTLDTIISNGITYVYPTYTKDIDMYDDWITGSVTLGRQTTIFDISIKSEYDISIFKERKNIFSKYETFANIKVNNPYDTTEDFVVFYKDEKKTRFNVSVSTGFDIIFRQPIFGITVGYTLIEF